jgi:phosphoglycolate phosphatase-like HAD superfamily hydrolase
MGLHQDVKAQIAAAEIDHFFDAVAGIRSAVSGGSKAGHLRDHLRQLGLDPKEVLVIGDVVDDAHAAAAVGARVVLVCTGMTDRETLDATGEAVADTLMQALELHLGSFAHASVLAGGIGQIEQVRCVR